MDPSLSEFDSFVRTRTSALLRSAYLLTGDQHLAEDLVQSALARTHRSWRRLHDSGNAEAYTRKTMYHLQVSWWRRGRVAESLSGEMLEPRRRAGEADHAQQTTVRLTLRAVLLKLCAKQRAGLVLRFFEDRGTIFYGPAFGGGAAPLHSWTPGAQPRRLASLPYDAALGNAMISPDGRQVSWVTEERSLYVAKVSGSDKRKLLDSVDSFCWGPTWSPDTHRLTVGVVGPSGEPTGKGFVDVVTGVYTESAALSAFEGCHPVWSANGQRIATAGGANEVFVMNAEGSSRRAIPGLGGSTRWQSHDLASLSPDGSRIALLRRAKTEDSGDVARQLDVNVVLDTRTGKAVALPLGGRQLLQAVFRADGSMLIRVKSDDGNVLLMAGADGRKLGESPEPTSLANQQILHAIR